MGGDRENINNLLSRSKLGALGIIKYIGVALTPVTATLYMLHVFPLECNIYLSLLKVTLTHSVQCVN